MSRSRVFAVSLLMLALGACATTGSRTQREAIRDYDQQYYKPLDAEKVTAVNIWAEKRGAKVLWINYPTKRGQDKQ
jgi:hypothetical protein